MEQIQSLQHYILLLSEIEATYHKANIQFGISDSYSIILYIIYVYGDNCPLHKIRYLSGLSKQTLNSAIKNMQQEGLADLRFIDGKSKTLCLTPKGTDLMKKTVANIALAENDILSSWSAEEIRTYLQLTERFLTTLKEKVERM